MATHADITAPHLRISMHAAGLLLVQICWATSVEAALATGNGGALRPAQDIVGLLQREVEVDRSALKRDVSEPKEKRIAEGLARAVHGRSRSRHHSMNNDTHSANKTNASAPSNDSSVGSNQVTGTSTNISGTESVSVSPTTNTTNVATMTDSANTTNAADATSVHRDNPADGHAELDVAAATEGGLQSQEPQPLPVDSAAAAVAANTNTNTNTSTANINLLNGTDVSSQTPGNSTASTEKGEQGWCGYQAQRGFLTAYTKPSSDNLLLDLTEAFRSSGIIRFVVTAMAVSGTYSDGTGYLTEYAYPMEETADTMFEFRLRPDNISVDVFKPQLDVRTTDNQMLRALKRGTGSGHFTSLPTFRCAKRQAANLFMGGTTPAEAAFLHNDILQSPGIQDKLLDEVNATAEGALAAAIAAAAAGGEASSPSAAANTDSLQEPGRTIVNAASLIRAGFFVAPTVKGASSYRLLSVKAFERNVDITVEYILNGDPLSVGFSVVKLPETPMKPRPADDRLLYFTTSYRDLGEHGQYLDELPGESVDRKVNTIWRYNLAALPGQQIRIHIDPTVPKRWRSWFRLGVEAWNEAFELLGKPEAVRAVLPEDPDWPQDYDVSDARFSTISWTISNQVVSMGIAKVDPRSGEILKSDIIMSDGWAQAWLGDLDLLAPNFTHSLDFQRGVRYEVRSDMAVALGQSRGGRGLRLREEGEEGWGKKISLLAMAAGKPLLNKELDEIIGRGLQNVVTHETGHILGLRHNFKGSLGVTYACIRSPSCSKVHGLTASVMDYIPVNLPSEQEPDVHMFTPILGGYDKLAIQYGYMETNDTLANSAAGGPRPQLQDELRQVLREAEKYETCYDDDRSAGQDPSCAAYDLSSDPLQAYEEEVLRLARVQSHLLNTSVMPGAPYTHYGEAVDSILLMAQGVGIKLVGWLGGVQNSYVNRHVDGSQPEKAARKALPRHVQKRALSLFLQLLRPGGLGLLPPKDSMPYLVSASPGGGNVEMLDVGRRVRMLARRLVSSALDPEQIARLYAQERLENAEDPSSFLSCGEFLSLFVKGIKGGSLRRSSRNEWDLQRQLVKGLKDIHESVLLPGEVRAHATHHLLRLRSDLEVALTQLELGERVDGSDSDGPVEQELMQAHLASLQQQVTAAVCSGQACNSLGSGALRRSGAWMLAALSAFLVSV